jgi:hypothetical protein
MKNNLSSHDVMKFLNLRLFTCAFLSALLLVFGAASSFALSWAQSYGVGSYDFNGALGNDPFYSSGYDTPLAIAKMPDGGFVVAGYLAMPKVWLHPGSYGPLGALIRYAGDGTILWQTLLRQNNDFSSNGQNYHALNNIGQIATDAQGNIFICGSKHGNGITENFNRGFVAKFSPDGALLWENGFNGGSATIGDPPHQEPIGTDSINYLGLTSDGGVIVTCAQSRPGFAYTIPVLAKFNADGSLAFTKAYDNGIQYLGSTPVCQSKDGTRYVMAFEYDTDGSTPGMRYGLLLLVTDLSGNIVAQRAYDHADNSGEHPIAIVATNDGNFATLSKLNDDGGFLLRKLNGDLSTEIFEKRVTRNGGGFLPGNSLTETSDGGFLIGSATATQPGATTGTDVVLFKLSSTGDFVFASALGGPLYEGYGGFGAGASIATELNGGGYGFAATSQSYHTGAPLSGFYHLPDWWMAKTDANRQVRNFHDVMEEVSESFFSITGSPQVAEDFAPFTPPNYPYGLTTTSSPSFVLENLAQETPPDLPTLTIQAAGPRILSDRTSEAIVEQHFTYQVFAVFFPETSTITYSADGLPQDFTIDPHTGIISGIAHVGSETDNLPPIPIVLHASDGIDTADLTLELSISDGPPTLSVDVYNNVLTFVAKQTGKLAGRVMRVQATATPENGSSWQNLANGTDGFMPYDPDSRSYILGSTDYPQGNGIYFRARLASPAYGELFSNVVGPFDLNPGKTRIGKTNLYITRNGLVSNIRFGVTEENVPSGIAVRIQTTKTPGSEGSWADVANGAMGQNANSPKEFYLGFDDYPSGSGNYFRAIASVPNSNYLDSISAPQGPFTFIYDPAATVTVTVPHNGSGDGNDYDLPISPESSSFDVTADAQSTRPLTKLALLYDGDAIQSFIGGATHGVTNYTTNVAGDHLIEAVAIDDLGILGTAKPVHLRVAPAAPGKIYYITQEGNWNDPSIWSDSDGNHGVPGAEDFAVLGSVNVHLTQNTTVRALSLNGGTMDGAKLIVTGWCTIGDGRILSDVDIADGATLLFINDADVGLGGTMTNFGRVKFHGKGGITSIPTGPVAGRHSVTDPNGIGNLLGRFINWVKTSLQAPAGGRQGSKHAPEPTPTPGPVLTAAPEVRIVAVASMKNSGTVEVRTANDSLISNDGGSVIGNDGASVIGNDGASLIGNDGGGLVDKNGTPIVATGGGNAVGQAAASLIGNDGGGLIGNDGAGAVAQGTGNLLASAANKIVATGGGNIVATGGGNLINTNSGGPTGRPSQVHGSVEPTPGYEQDDGATNLSGLTIIGSVKLTGGMLRGSGAVVGDLENDGGFIAPGHSSGAMAITGNFVQATEGVMILEAAGGEAGEFDQVQVGANATLGGALQFHTLNGYAPLPEDPMNPLGYSSADGSFDYASSNGNVTVTPNGVALVLQPTATNPLSLTSAVSRKTHGAAGPFDIALPLTGPAGVECRNSNGNHTIVFSFSNNITAASASLTSNTGAVADTTIAGNSVAVSLSGIGNAQQISVTLQGVIDEFGQMLPDITVPMKTLVGDTNGNGNVNASDVSQTKAQSGQTVTVSNYREDVTVNGTVNASDVSLVKARSGTGVGQTAAGNTQPGR